LGRFCFISSSAWGLNISIGWMWMWQSVIKGIQSVVFSRNSIRCIAIVVIGSPGYTAGHG
jgi:hypothetical protein